MLTKWNAVVLLPLLLGACQRPPAPPTDRPPEPQASALRDGLQRPLDAAHAAQQRVDRAAAAQRQAIDTATQ